MAFSRGLYYPWIDIQDEAWLKTAALYWDTLQTIVPRDMRHPYATATASGLFEAGIIEPFFVAPDMADVEELTKDVLNYFETSEGLEVLSGRATGQLRHLHASKLPREILRLSDMHRSKLPDYVWNRLNEIFAPASRSGRGNDWLAVDERFAAFYMTLLATRLSERHGLGLVTDTSTMDGLAVAARLDSRQTLSRPRWHRFSYAGADRNPDVPPMLAEGMLASLALERLNLDPETPTEKIIKFREQHADELARFRASVGALTSSLEGQQPINSLRQHVEDLYKNEVRPSVSDLKKALKGGRIKFAAENFVKVTCFSLGATSLPLNVLGLAAPFAILVGAGVSLTASLVLYNHEKERLLADNPYAYLLAAERHFY